MNLAWITFGNISFSSDDKNVTSNTASVRYRVISPMIELEKLGYDSKVFSTDPSAYKTPEINQKTDVVIFSKSFNKENEELINYLKSQGKKVIFDICDNHFATPQFSEHYKFCTNNADLVTCNTEAMAGIISQYTDVNPIIIPDPYEVLKSAARFEPADILKLVWFGHPSNLDSLESVMQKLVDFSNQHPLSIKIITSEVNGLQESCSKISSQLANLELIFMPWSIEAQWQSVTGSDIVIIPSLQDERKKVKSPNRVFESLQCGTMVVANPLPSYMPFKDFAWIGDDIIKGIKWTLDNKELIKNRIEQGQEYIVSHHSPEVIGEKWNQAINQL